MRKPDLHRAKVIIICLARCGKLTFCIFDVFVDFVVVLTVVVGGVVVVVVVVAAAAGVAIVIVKHGDDGLVVVVVINNDFVDACEVLWPVLTVGGRNAAAAVAVLIDETVLVALRLTAGVDFSGFLETTAAELAISTAVSAAAAAAAAQASSCCALLLEDSTRTIIAILLTR
uniref:Uncharacterized protein n=1 Tax=Glossina brevipalpis TaxID=37001 RepID=A0A1A9W353_9MUSC